MKFKILVLLLSVMLSACAHNFTLTNFKDSEVLQGSYSELMRSVKVTMPNGEILEGEYSDISNASFMFGNSLGSATATSGLRTSTGFSSNSLFGMTSGGVSKAYALLKSKKSKLMMQIQVEYSTWTGHGYGDAQTNDGRAYKVQF